MEGKSWLKEQKNAFDVKQIELFTDLQMDVPLFTSHFMKKA